MEQWNENSRIRSPRSERAPWDGDSRVQIGSMNDALAGRAFLWNSHTENVRVPGAPHRQGMALVLKPHGKRLMLVVNPVLENVTFTLRTLDGQQEQAVTGHDGICFFTSFPDERFTLSASDLSSQDERLSDLASAVPTSHFAGQIRWLMNRNRHLRLPCDPAEMRMPAVLSQRIRAEYDALLRDQQEEGLYHVQDALERK